MKTIRELREEKELTQAQLAARLEVTPSSVYNWERGRTTPSVPQLRAIAKFFGVCTDSVALIGLDVGERWQWRGEPAS